MSLGIEALPSFLRFISSFPDDTKAFDWGKLWKTLQNAMSILPYSSDPPSGFAAFFHFAERLLRGDVLNRRLVGAQILALGVKCARSTFDDFKRSTTVVQILLEGDLHSQLLDKMSDFLDELINADTLNAFWDRAESAYSSQRPQMFSIISRSLQKASPASAGEFLVSIAERPQLSEELVDFVAASMKTVACEAAVRVARVLIDLGCRGQFTANATAGLSAFAAWLPHDLIVQEFIVEECKRRLSDVESQDFAAALLAEFVKRAPHVGEFNERFVETVVEAVAAPGARRVPLFALLRDAINQNKKAFTGELVERLAAIEIDSAFWVFLGQVLEKLVREAFYMGAQDVIVRIVEAVDPTAASVEFLEFVQAFVKVVAIGNGKISVFSWESRPIPIEFSAYEFPLQHMDVILGALSRAEDAAAAEKAGSILVDFVEKSMTVSISKIFEYFQTFFDECRKQGTLAKGRAVSILRRFVEKFGDRITTNLFFGKRHKPMNSDDQIGHVYAITVTIIDGLETFEMVTLDTVLWPQFKEKVACRIGLKSWQFDLHLNGARVMPTDHSALYACGAQRKSKFTVCPHEGVQRMAPPQVRLTGQLLEEIRDSPDLEYQSACRKLLNYLPSDYSVIASLEDMPAFLTSLESVTNHHIFRYKLEVLAHAVLITNSRAHAVFTSDLGASFLVKTLDRNDSVFKGLSQILELMRNFSHESLTKHREVIPRLLTFFGQLKKHKVIVIDILESFLRTSPIQTTELLVANREVLTRAIASFDDISFSRFNSGCIQYLSDPKWLIGLCLDDHPDPATAHYFFGVLKEVVRRVHDVNTLRETMRRCLVLFPTAKGKSLLGLSQVISTIVKTSNELANEFSDQSPEFLKIALRSEDPALRSDLLAVCSNLSNKQFLMPLLKRELQISLDRWSYKPDGNTQTLPGYVGLRNLGSTCYMNAILQQLFFTFPFRYLLLTSEPKDEAQLQLKRIFTELATSRRPYSDTQPFCAIWKGWGKHSINPREQQDAFEFLQLLLDQLSPSMNSIFKGTIRNTIEGISETYYSINPEDFYTFGLDIKNFKNVEQSFQHFLENETFRGDNQYSIGDRKIDARKFSRIDKAPAVLVLQLKRFDYNLESYERQKITNRYEFTPIIDIAPYMAEPAQTLPYELKGVVLHSGTAQGGHYTSLIRRSDKWISFNDTEVTELLAADFADAAFGGSHHISQYADFDSGTSAYLLFYTRVGATLTVADSVLRYDTEFSFEARLDPAIVEDIEDKNQEHFKLQSLFHYRMCEFMAKINDADCLLSYFLNVFCHSGLDTWCRHLQTPLHALLIPAGGPEFVVGFCVVHFPAVAGTYLNCSSEEIMRTFNKFIARALELAQPDVGFPLVQLIFGLLTKAMAGPWRQTTPITKCIARALAQSGYLSAAAAADFHLSVLDFLATVFDAARSTMIFSNLDLSQLFDTTSRLLEARPEPAFGQLLKYAPHAVLSLSHARQYSALLSRLCRLGIIDIVAFAAAVESGRADTASAVADTLIGIIGTDDRERLVAVMRIALQPRYVDYFARKLTGSDVCKAFSQFPDLVALPLLTHETESIRLSAKYAVKSLFPNEQQRAPITTAAVAFLNGIGDMGQFVRYGGYTSSFFRLDVLLKLVRHRTPFEILSDLYKRSLADCERNGRTPALDVHVRLTANALLRFPPALSLGLFQTFHSVFFSEIMPKSAAGHALAVFRPVLPHLPLEDMRLIVQHSSFSDGISDSPDGCATTRVLAEVLQSHSADPECARALGMILTASFKHIQSADLALYLPAVRAGVHFTPDTIERLMACVRDSFVSAESLPKICEFALALFKHPAVRTRFDPVDPVYIEALAMGVGDEAAVAIARDFLKAYGYRKSVMIYLRGAKTVGALCLLFALLIDSGEEAMVAVDACNAGEKALEALGVIVPGPDVPIWAREVIAKMVEVAPVIWNRKRATQFCRAAVRAMPIEEMIGVIERLKAKRKIMNQDLQLMSEMVSAFPAEKERIMAAVGAQGSVANSLEVVFGSDLD